MSWFQKLNFLRTPKPKPVEPPVKKAPTETSPVVPETSDSGFFGMTPAALQALVDIEEKSQASFFGQALERVKEVVRKTNQNLPQLERGGKVPLGEVLYHTEASSVPADYKGPIAILIPEVHLQGNPFRESPTLRGGITPHVIKTFNVRLLKEIFNDPELVKEIQTGFNETSMNIEGLGVSPEAALANPSIDAADVLEHLLRTHGNSIEPSESIQESIQTQIVLSTLSALKRGSASVDISMLNNYIGVKDQKGIRTEVDQAISKIAQRTGMKGLIELGDDIDVLKVNSSQFAAGTAFQAFGEEFVNLNFTREKAIASKFKSKQGVVPMVLGSAHLKSDQVKNYSLISLLKEIGVPVICVGAKPFESVLKS